MERYIFLDTMVFLHFRPLDELDLAKVVGAQSITVVVPRITIRELDKHKSTHPHKRIQERAKRVLHDLETAMESGNPLKGRITVEYFPDFPDEQLSRLNLNPEWGDDVLIASLIAYREKMPDRLIALISQDSGPRLTCKHNGISAFQIDSDLQLPEEADEAEKELRELRRENQRLRDARPRLEIGFSEGDILVKHRKYGAKAPRPIDENEIHRLLLELKETHPRIPVPQKPLFDDGFQALLQNFEMNPVTPDRIKQYNTALDRFFVEMEEYYRAEHQNRSLCSLVFSFEIAVQNNGTMSAEDVDLSIQFPRHIPVVQWQPSPPTLRKPQAPEPPKSGFESFGLSANSFRQSFEFPDVSSRRLAAGCHPRLRRQKDSTHIFSQNFHRVKHGSSIRMEKLFIHFKTVEDARNFDCEYVLSAANITERINGKLHFVVELA